MKLIRRSCFRFWLALCVAFGGSLVWFPIEAAGGLAFGQVEFILDLLLPTRQEAQALGIFKRRFDL